MFTVTLYVFAFHCAVSVTLPPALLDRFLKYTVLPAQTVLAPIAVVGLFVVPYFAVV